MQVSTNSNEVLILSLRENSWRMRKTTQFPSTVTSKQKRHAKSIDTTAYSSTSILEVPNQLVENATRREGLCGHLLDSQQSHKANQSTWAKELWLRVFSLKKSKREPNSNATVVSREDENHDLHDSFGPYENAKVFKLLTHVMMELLWLTTWLILLRQAPIDHIHDCGSLWGGDTFSGTQDPGVSSWVFVEWWYVQYATCCATIRRGFARCQWHHRFATGSWDPTAQENRRRKLDLLHRLPYTDFLLVQ